MKYYLKNNVSQQKISEIFGISRQTFVRWLKQYELNDLDRKQRITSSYKIKQKHVEFALKELKKNNSISISVLWSKLKKKFDDFEISQSHLHDVIRDNI